MSNYYFPEHDVAFVHIPKTGGLTIRDGIFRGKWKQSFGEEKFNCRSFAFIRHPEDRFISCMRYLWNNGYVNLSTDDALGVVSDSTIPHHNEGYFPWAKHHLLPQTHTYNNLKNAQIIGRFERFREDLSEIFKKLNIPLPDIPHINKSKPNKVNISDETRKKLREVYKEDYKLYG